MLFPPLISFHGGREGTAEPKYFSNYSWHRLFYYITGSFPTLLSAVNIFENNFSCWIVYSVGYLQYSRILQIQYPHQAKIFLLYLQIYHQFLESGLTDMRCSTSFFLGALILRGVNVETSGVFGHHYLNSATVQKPGLQTFGEILCIALIHPLWSELSPGRSRVSFFGWILYPVNTLLQTN